ncbi:MAG: sortase [Candidatus Paceibacterota bacterium]|jgi:LPXTG-site transpeptidase (sortase) family protein
MKFFSSFIIWLVIFAASYTLLLVADLAPMEIKEMNAVVLSLFDKKGNAVGPLANDLPTLEPDTSTTGKQPIRLMIEKIGVNSPVENPQSRDLTVLDEALLKGVVHYPGSGSLESNTNMFLFGHSTNWVVVNNQAFKSLNRLNELRLGDEIKLFSDEKEYRYKVTKVELVDQNEVLVKFEVGKRKLTLSTCDSFGKKTDRFVVEADYIGEVLTK